jgi:hypothetical protein
MIVRITAAGLDLQEAEDFTAFSATSELEDAELASTLESLGGAVAGEGTHVWLPAEALTAAAPSASPAWLEQFDGMVAYARSKGWTDEAGRLRAHVTPAV